MPCCPSIVPCYMAIPAVIDDALSLIESGPAVTSTATSLRTTQSTGGAAARFTSPIV
jgi:hypothetical protein